MHTYTLVFVNASNRRPSSSADNNYFRHFLAFHAASPSIRKSYKPTVTFTPKFKTGREGRGAHERRGREPRSRVSPCLVKYHLIPREIRFNFARHNTPATSPAFCLPSVYVVRPTSHQEAPRSTPGPGTADSYSLRRSPASAHCSCMVYFQLTMGIILSRNDVIRK